MEAKLIDPSVAGRGMTAEQGGAWLQSKNGPALGLALFAESGLKM